MYSNWFTKNMRRSQCLRSGQEIQCIVCMVRRPSIVVTLMSFTSSLNKVHALFKFHFHYHLFSIHGKWTSTVELTIYCSSKDQLYINGHNHVVWPNSGIWMGCQLSTEKLHFLFVSIGWRFLNSHCSYNCSLSTPASIDTHNNVLDLHESHGLRDSMCKCSTCSKNKRQTLTRETPEASHTWSEMKLPDIVSIERQSNCYCSVFGSSFFFSVQLSIVSGCFSHAYMRVYMEKRYKDVLHTYYG